MADDYTDVNLDGTPNSPWKPDSETVKTVRTVAQMSDVLKGETNEDKAGILTGELVQEAYKALQTDDEDKLQAICKNRLKNMPGDYRWLLLWYQGNEEKASARVVKHMRDCRDKLPIQSWANNASMDRAMRFLDSLCHKKLKLEGRAATPKVD